MTALYDVTIMGAGIVGLATAMKLAEAYPRTKLLVLEKESRLASHQTGHNSGVIHSGIYYKPGSLKARTCVAGRTALLEFCDQHGVPYELCGKVIVATSDHELPRLEELQRRSLANGLKGVELIGYERLKELEPYATGIRALHVPATGIIDYTKVAEAYAAEIHAAGGAIRTSSRVAGIIMARGEIILQTASGDYRTMHVINCCGLYSDVIARQMATSAGQPSQEGCRIIPFRGEYYKLTTARQHLVQNLIYPVPDPAFPFLGVHFTRMLRGGVEAGPNAVLAYAREGYRKTDVNIEDLWRMVSFKGFWAMAGRYWRTGFGEFYRSLRKEAFVKALQSLLPEITPRDLVPGGSGVRAQAVSASGTLVDDFVIQQSRNAIHVLNAPSPGATASLAIGRSIAEMAAKSFALKG
ncbi:MAG TPA: L-2-hydroxyglutarate oxidase [Terriglobales bacterium]|nr:L-2-hydroxyglutarate oxidase [Terriglobales bacterium]